MPPITKSRKRMSGLLKTGVTWRSSNCRPTRRNSMPPNGSGTTHANTPLTTATSKNPRTSAALCSAPFARSNAIRKRLPILCSHFFEHDVELFMRVYIGDDGGCFGSHRALKTASILLEFFPKPLHERDELPVATQIV